MVDSDEVLSAEIVVGEDHLDVRHQEVSGSLVNRVASVQEPNSLDLVSVFLMATIGDCKVLIVGCKDLVVDRTAWHLSIGEINVASSLTGLAMSYGINGIVT